MTASSSAYQHRRGPARRIGGATAATTPTTHMLTLGSSADDDDDSNELTLSAMLTTTPNTSYEQHEEIVLPSSSSPLPWWRRVLQQQQQQQQQRNGSTITTTTTATNENEPDTNYTSLNEGELAATSEPAALPPNGSVQLSPQRHTAVRNSGPRGMQESLLVTPLDQQQQQQQQQQDALVLRQDVDFFYHDLPTTTTRPLKSRSSGLMRTVRPDAHLSSYADTIDVMAPPVLQAYRARYTQLNQTLEHYPRHYNDNGDHDDDDDNHNIDPNDDVYQELALHVQDHHSHNNAASAGVVPAGIVRSSPAQHSSLFYRHLGRLLMKLPQDNVKLLMDGDLEAGVLSVEQWRRQQPRPSSTTLDEAAGHNHDWPELRYVLTVPDDLYRRLMDELAAATGSRSHGCCGHEHQQADIRIAISILAVIFAILLLSTLLSPVG